MTDIAPLIARVGALTGPDREVDYEITRKVLKRPIGTARWTKSVDAAIALVERVLPGWRIENLCEWDHERLRSRGPWTCDLVRRGKDFADHFPAKCSHAPSPAIALVIAALKALQAQEADRG